MYNPQIKAEKDKHSQDLKKIKNTNMENNINIIHLHIGIICTNDRTGKNMWLIDKIIKLYDAGQNINKNKKEVIEQ
jgi:hypothetical protein